MRMRLAAIALLLGTLACAAQAPAATGKTGAKGATGATTPAKKTMPSADLRRRLYLINQLIQTGRVDEAQQSLDQLRLEAGQEPVIDGMEAFLLYRRHDYMGSRDELIAALKTPEAPVWWRVLLAMDYEALDKSTAAKEELARAENEDLQNTQIAVGSLGIAALNDCNQAPSPEGSMVLAFIYRNNNRRNLELATYEVALKKFPTSVRVWLAFLNLLVESAQDPKATVVPAERAIKAVPDSDALQALAGSLYARMGENDKAVAALQKAIQLNPANLGARVDLAAVYRTQKKLAEAIKELDTVVAANPPPAADILAGAYASLGGVMTDSKRWQEADAALQKGLEAAPENPSVLNNLAWLYATSEAPETRNPAKAVELAIKANMLAHQRNPAILDTLAEAYNAAGNHEKAIETAHRAVDMAPGNAEFKDHLTRLQGGSPAAPVPAPKP